MYRIFLVNLFLLCYNGLKADAKRGVGIMSGTAEWFWKIFMLTGSINAYLGYKELASNY